MNKVGIVITPGGALPSVKHAQAVGDKRAMDQEIKVSLGIHGILLRMPAADTRWTFALYRKSVVHPSLHPIFEEARRGVDRMTKAMQREVRWRYRDGSRRSLAPFWAIRVTRRSSSLALCRCRVIRLGKVDHRLQYYAVERWVIVVLEHDFCTLSAATLAWLDTFFCSTCLTVILLHDEVPREQRDYMTAGTFGTARSGSSDLKW